MPRAQADSDSDLDSGSDSGSDSDSGSGSGRLGPAATAETVSELALLFHKIICGILDLLRLRLIHYADEACRIYYADDACLLIYYADEACLIYYTDMSCLLIYYCCTARTSKTSTAGNARSAATYVSPFAGNSVICMQTLRIAPDLIINKQFNYRCAAMRYVGLEALSC